MTGYYVTDPADPDAPVALEEYNGIKPGDRVRYENPEAPWLPPLLGSLTVSAIYQFIDNGHGGWLTAILNDGEYEVDATNLRLTRDCPDGGTCHHDCGRGGCFRVDWASPLSVAGWGDTWPEEVRKAEHSRGPGGHL
jgi:hypothetical protein